MPHTITAIKQLFRIKPTDADSKPTGVNRQIIEQYEQHLPAPLPALLFHYYHELGNISELTRGTHHLALLPIPIIDEYIVIAKTAVPDAIWGIAVKQLTQTDPMIVISRNYDSVDPRDIHWLDDQRLSAFLLAQAIYNGLAGGSDYRAHLYDFLQEQLPADIETQLANHLTEISSLRQTHERYFECQSFGLVALLSLAEDLRPSALWVGGQDVKLYEQFLARFMLKWDYITPVSLT